MPPSATRSSTKRKAGELSTDPPPTAEQSSPLPTRKRPRASTSELKTKSDSPATDESEAESEKVRNGSGHSRAYQSGALATQDDVLASQVIQQLRTASFPVNATRDYNNANIVQEPSIRAYAKIAAADWTFYIQTTLVKIGRSSEPSESRQADGVAAEKNDVHIDLGPNKVFSRETAAIYFDSNRGDWCLQVKGRNGLKVDGSARKRSDAPHPLRNGEVIEIGGVEMMFVSPGSYSPLRISDTFLRRLDRSPAGSTLAPEPRHALPLPRFPPLAPSPSTRPTSSRGRQQAIAPAPPHWKRPGTPPLAKFRVNPSDARSPGQPGPGTMLESIHGVDMSLDEHKLIKPLYSYGQLITQAIISTPEHKLSLSGIYSYITDTYAYYRHQPAQGWQNSIRHNLSLNDKFMKTARPDAQTGKGMLWSCKDEAKDELVANAWKLGRGGHRGSAPSSPNPVDQSTGQRRQRIASARRRRVPPVTSPRLNSTLVFPQMTPDRRTPTLAASPHNGSPQPRSRRPPLSMDHFLGNDEAPAAHPTAPASSYFQDESPPLVTPAPHRVQPRLAPPSTAQRPSQHMPTSSPVGFWKYVLETPVPFAAQSDISPTRQARDLPVRSLRSSSLPQPDNDPMVASPSRKGRVGTPDSTTAIGDDDRERDENQGRQQRGAAPPQDGQEEEVRYDLASGGFIAIGAFHPQLRKGSRSGRNN